MLLSLAQKRKRGLLKRLLQDDSDDHELIKRLRKRSEVEDQDTFLLANSILGDKTKPRTGPLVRNRWNEPYLRKLAVDEGSFLTEFRMPPDGFDKLTEMLRSRLEVNQNQASNATKSGSFPTIFDGSLKSTAAD
jgi:hypothetical protein